MPPHRQPRAGSVTQQLKNLTDALLDSNRAVPVNRNHSRGRSGESQAAQPLSAWGASFSEVTPGSLHILSTSTTQQSNDGNRKRKRDVKPAEQSILLPPPQRPPVSAVQSNVNENANDTTDDGDDGYESDECIAGTQPSQSGRFGGYSMIDPSVLELDNPYSDNGNDNDHEDEEGDVNESQVEDSEMDSVAESDVEYKHPSKRLIRDDSAVNYSDSDDDINADYGEDSTFIGPSQYVDHLNRFSDAGMSSIVMSSQPEMVDLLDNNDVKRDSILQQQQQQQQHLAPTREPSAVDDLDDVPESVIRVPFNNTQPSVAETPLVNTGVAGGRVNRALRQSSVAESPAPIPESQPVHNDSAAEMEMAETPQSKQQNKNRQIPSEIAETPHADQNVNNQFVPETGPRILALETQYTGTSESVDADVSFDTLDSLDTQKIDQMIMQQQSQSQLQPQPPVAVKRRLGSRNKSKTVAISKEQSFDTNQRGRLEQLRSAGLPSVIMETQAPEPMDIDIHTAEVEQQLQNHSRLLSSPPMDPLPSDIASDAVIAAADDNDEDDVFESSANSPTEMSFSLPAKIGQSPSDQQLTQSNPVRIPTTSGTPVAKRRPLKPAGTSMLTAYSRASIRPGSSMLRMTPSALDNSSSSSSNNAIPPTTAVTRPRRRILSILDGIPSTSRSSSTLQPAAAASTSTRLSMTSATSTLMSLPPPSSQSSQPVQPAASTPASDPVIMRTPKALKIPTQQRRTLVMSGIMSPRQVSMTPYLKVMPQRPALKVKRRGTNARKTLSVAFEDEQRPSVPSQRERQQQQQIQRQPSPARSNQSEIRNTTITATSVIDSIETTSESSVATDNQTTTVTPATEGQYRSGDRVWARLDQMPAFHPATVSRVVTTSGNSSTFTCDVKFDDGTRATCKSRNIAHLDIRDGDKVSVIVREWSSLSMPAIARSEPRLAAANNNDISSTSTSTATSTAGSKFVVDVEWKLPNAVHSMRSGNSTVISRKNGVNSSALRETVSLSRVSITATMLTAIKKRRTNAPSTSNNNSSSNIVARNPRAAVPIFTPPGARPPPAAQAQRLFTGLAFVLTFPTLNTIGSQQQQQLQQQSGEPAHLPVDPTRTKAALSAHIARNGGKIIADIPAMESYSKRPMPKSKRQQLASNRLTMSSSAPASSSNPTISATDSIILVAPHRVRTAKFLMAVALGIKCVSFEWIRACARAGQLIDTAQYELANIHPTTRAVEGFMSGLKISVVGSRKFRSQWDAILNAAGATIVPHPSHSSSATTASEGQTECDIVLAEGPPGSPDGSEAGIASMQTGLVCHRTKIGDLDWIEEAGRPPPVVSAEWALESVMEHKVLGWKSQPLFTLQPSDSH